MAITRETLLGFMKSELGVPISKLKDDTSLFGGGIIDSHMLLQIVTYVEAETKLKIPTIDLSIENFDTLGNILAYIGRRTSGG
jgi:acyl carrier protein